MSISLRQNENLIKVVRQHWFFMVPTFVGWLAVLVVLLIVRYAIPFNFWGYWSLIFLLAVLIVAVIISYRFYLWRRNALVITDQRVVYFEQEGILSKTVTELLLPDVMEVAYVKNGINASTWNFGDIKIRTASDNTIVIPRLPAPDEVMETINRIRQDYRTEDKHEFSNESQSTPTN